MTADHQPNPSLYGAAMDRAEAAEAALEAVLEICDVANLAGMFIDPRDVHSAISRTFADQWDVSSA